MKILKLLKALLILGELKGKIKPEEAKLGHLVIEDLEEDEDLENEDENTENKE